MQCFLGDLESRTLNLENHWLTLAIMKKTLDENHFRKAHKTTDRKLPFQLGDRVYFKNKQPWKWDLKWRPKYRIFGIEQDGHYLHIENQATVKTGSCNIKDIVHEPPIEFWNIDTQFGRARKLKIHPFNLLTIKLSNWKWTCTACKQPPINNLQQHIHHLYSIFLLGMLISATLEQESWESVLFHPVLRAYPTCHSWIITVHDS